MILITGATGTIGSQVLPLLTASGASVRAMTRNPSQISSAAGIDIVEADFDDPDSLAPTVAGVDTMFLVTAPPSPSPRWDIAMLDAACAAGVTRVVKLSAIGTGETGDDGTMIGASHAQAEEAVRNSGMAWTILRPTTFASNTLWWANAINVGDPVTNLTGSGAQGIVDPRDVAAVAVETLMSPSHTGQTYTLTGPDLLSVPDQAALLEKALDRPVLVADTPLNEARQQMLASGMDPSAVDMIITGSAWARAGNNAVVTNDVAQILNRPPTSFETWINDHRTAFAIGGRSDQ